MNLANKCTVVITKAADTTLEASPFWTEYTVVLATGLTIID